ncbi:unnamed protein product [Ectocarpus sp. CCAP 1310/34]|nr:unnamed protein product [Ectocarpus sp. CCAP 1310/34]
MASFGWDRKLAHDNNISSVHVNFCTEEEVNAKTVFPSTR